jgi:hypothetical protein
MELTYHYSPFFSGTCYRKLSVNKSLFEKHVGDAGLLDLLELRLGLPGRETSAIGRILAYQSALDAVRKDAFYDKAFENDPLATAKEILRWRDLLVMEGFDADTGHESPRLRKLAEAEKYFCEPGTPERWKEVRAHAKGPLAGVNIIVDHDIRLLPKLIRESLAAIGVEKGVYDGLGEKEAAWNPEGKDITIRYFGTVTEAYQWAADHDKSGCDVVVCPDPFRLNGVLRNRGKALLDASAEGDSPILQLFRLGLLLLERPLDIKNLLEYLRAGFSPIPARQRHALARALKSEGGRGKEWKKALVACEDTPEVGTFLKSLLDAEIIKGKVAKTVIIDWCRAISDWAGDTTKTPPERMPYQMELTGLCEGLCRVVGTEAGDEVDVGFVLKALKTLYEPTPVRTVKAMAGSWDVIDSHRSLIDAPDSLLWLPCNGGLGSSYPYTFLFQEELKELGLRSMTDFIRHDFNLMAERLGKAGRIELCACDFDRNEALEEHPAVTLCKPAAHKAEKEMDMRTATDGLTTSVFSPLRTLDTGVDLYPKDRNEKGEETKDDTALSATSIETLIGYPFDFVMDKKLRFKDLSSLQLSNLTLTQGTVAHYVFEKLLKDSEGRGSIPKMRTLLQENVFYPRVDTAAGEKGEILFQPENRTLFAHFKETVRKSIGVLLDILDKSGLTPKKSELKLNEELDGLSRISGSVDFYAETKGGNVVVIDFKYSKGSYYIEKLKEDRSVQLEIYAEGLFKKTGRPVVAKAYYFFPINQLYTDDTTGLFLDPDGRPFPGVIPLKKKAGLPPLSQRIRSSVDLRKTQLKKGRLEMEEGAPLDEIDYHEAAMDGSLIDIPSTGRKDCKVKAPSPFANPTKYPILKNSIK